MYICDNHVHTRYSFDGHDTADEVCRCAVANGVDEISITDHFDIDCVQDGLYPPFDADGARAEIFAAREKYKNSLVVNYGIELGQAVFREKDAREFISKYGFDYVLASVHNLDGVPDFAFLDYAEMPDALIESLFSRSLDALIKTASLHGISTLAHITYPHRYAKTAGRDINFSKYTDKLKTLFGVMIENRVILELNVSTLEKCGITMPTPELLRLYRECGGELVTCGSDSHYAAKIGKNIETGYSVLRDAGFRYFAVVRGGAPVMMPL